VEDGSVSNGKDDDMYNCNHHHVISDDQEMVDLGRGAFVADKEMLPLLRALNDAGIATRTHCCGHGSGHSFLGIIIADGMHVDIRKVHETDAARDTFRGETELLISWSRT
jgi:hypothetical protein